MLVFPFFVGLSIMSLYVEGVCIAYSLFFIYFIILLCLISVIFKKSLPRTQCLCPRLFVGLLVCHQVHTKTSQQISIKLGWTMGLVPEKTPLTFGVDVNDKVTDPGTFSTLLNTA